MPLARLTFTCAVLKTRGGAPTVTAMRRLLALGFAALAFAAATAGSMAGTPAVSPAMVAKSCSSGWTHAIIGGEHKCLRAGQYCARRYESQYHRYSYHCHKRDSAGRYHLTR